MAYDSARGKMVLFSGNAGAGAATAGTWSPETWEWDGTAGTWTLITAPVVTSTQYGSGYTNMVYDPVINKIVLYYYWNYVWTYTAGATAGTGTWADAAPVPTKVDTAVSGYYNPGMVYDAGRQKVVVFGGQGSGRVAVGAEHDRPSSGRTDPRPPTARSSASTRRSPSTARRAS